MAKQSRDILKGYFETGDRPTEGQYSDLIDSHVLLSGENTGSLNLLGDISVDGHLTSSGHISGSSTTTITIGGDATIGGDLNVTGNGIFSQVNTGQGLTEVHLMNQNIRTSDNVEFVNITATGNTILGNASTDTHTFTGHITSSNHISASANIIADMFFGDGTNILNITSSHINVTGVIASFTTGSLHVSGNLFYSSASSTVLKAIESSGSILPEGSGEYDLGSPTNYWRTAFISSSHAITSIADNFYGNFKGNADSATTATTATTATFINATSNDSTNESGFITFVDGASGAQGIETDTGLRYNPSTNGITLGQVTASGNISASGTITSTEGFTGTLLTAAQPNITSLGTLTGLNASGNISTSGDISALSGSFTYITSSVIDVDASTIRIGGTPFSKTDVDNLKDGKMPIQTARAGFTNRLQPEAIFGKHDGDYIKFTIGNRIGTFLNGSLITDLNFTGSNNYIALGLNDNTQLRFTGQITASSHISASGTIVANKIESDALVSHAGDANTGLQFASDTVNIEANDAIIGKFSSTKVELNSPVTASGNISASGFISTDSHITASGKISASGDITANRFFGDTITGNFIALDSSGTNLGTNGGWKVATHITASGNIKSLQTVTALTGAFSHIVGNSPITFGGDDSFVFGSDINLGITASGGDAKLLNTNDQELIEPLLQGTFTPGFQESGRTLFGQGQEVALYSKGATKIYSLSGSNTTMVGSYILIGSGSLHGGNSIANTDPHTIRFGSGSNTHPQLGDYYEGTDTVIFDTSAGHITASGNISASGNIVASNLSGTNTGDQDLSNLITNSQTSSFVQNSSTSSFVTNSQTASFAVTGSDVLFGNITSSGNISASGTLIVDTLDVGDFPADFSNINKITGSLNIIGGNSALNALEVKQQGGGGGKSALKLIAGTGNIQPTLLIENGGTREGINVEAGTNGLSIVASGHISTSGNINTDSHITASGNISASGTIIASNLSGTNTGDQDLSTYIQNSQTSSFVLNSATSSFITATQTSSFVQNSSTSSFVINSQTGSFLTNANTSSFNSLDVSGSLVVTGSATFGTGTVTINGTAGHITASGNISASGTVIASNLSGTNTGDQDLSTYIQNSQTSSFVLNSATSSFLVSSDTGSLGTTIVTGSGTATIVLNTLGEITASGNISSSGTIIGSNLSGTNTGDQDLSTYIQNSQTSSFVLTSQSSSFLTAASTSSLITAAQTSSFSFISTLVANSATSSFITNTDTGSFSNVIITGSGTTNITLNTTGNLTASGNITAGGNISSSGTILSNDAEFGGSTSIDNNNIVYIDGDGGHITASGNISSSGVVTGLQGVFGTGTLNTTLSISASSALISTDVISASGNIISLGNVTAVSMSGDGSGLTNLTATVPAGTYSSSLQTLGNITSSGNISSSGTIIGSNLSGTNTGDQDLSTYIQNSQTSSFVLNSATSSFITATQTSSFVQNSATSSFVLNSATSSFLVSSDTGSLGTTIITGSGTTNITLSTAGHITASGNISASGKLIATSLNTGQGDYELYNMNQNVTTTSPVIFNRVDATNFLANSGSTVLGDNTSDTHTITGNITSSGNISSSGTIQSVGNITTNGTLSTDTLHITSSVNGAATSSLVVAANFSDIRFENLPTNRPTVTGSLWLSGSAGQGSKFLVVFTG